MHNDDPPPPEAAQDESSISRPLFLFSSASPTLLGDFL